MVHFVFDRLFPSDYTSPIVSVNIQARAVEGLFVRYLTSMCIISLGCAMTEIKRVHFECARHFDRWREPSYGRCSYNILYLPRRLLETGRTKVGYDLGQGKKRMTPKSTPKLSPNCHPPPMNNERFVHTHVEIFDFPLSFKLDGIWSITDYFYFDYEPNWIPDSIISKGNCQHPMIIHRIWKKRRKCGSLCLWYHIYCLLMKFYANYQYF